MKHTKRQRRASLDAVRKFPVLKLGPLALKIMVFNGGCAGPWYLVVGRPK
jgi:hypothetical protein